MTPAQLAFAVSSDSDLAAVRQALREVARSVGLGLVRETKLITAGSEMVRNVFAYAIGGVGSVSIEAHSERDRQGVRVTCRDDGPGIPDIEAALHDGFSTGGGFGVGLPGTKRLVDEFSIVSSKAGTIVEIVMWAS